ncbi:MAG: ATP-binding cassette domain-containing protein [[Eubacterium] sulci]|nr:ATP-binding cassette domain-containing protein [[Eubacterium] sulci]
MNVLRCSSIGYKIGDRTIFDGINYEFEPYKVTAITGVSGSGKSSLLNILGLITDPTSGKLYWDQEVTNNWTENKRTDFWKNQASFIFQDYGVIGEESVGYNVSLKSNVSKEEKNTIEKILSHVGLANRFKDNAEVLSGGEKQRLGVARAIYKKSDIIFADEPTASLDIENRTIIVNLLKERASKGVMVIVATHDEELLKECDDIFRL